MGQPSVSIPAMPLKPKILLLIMGMLACLHTLSARSPVILNEENQYTVTPEYFRVIRDCDNQLSLNEIAFQPQAKEQSHAAADCHGYWLEFSVRNTSSNQTTWYLEVSDPHIDSVTLYTREGAIGQSGFYKPFEQREYAHKNHLFRLPLQPGEESVFYLKLNPHYEINFTFLIRSDRYTLAYALQEYTMLGMYYGIILIMAVYNLFIYWSIREKTYLFYVFYAFSCGLRSFTEDGLGFQFLWPSYPATNYIIELISSPLLLISFALYSNSFLAIRRQLPGMYKLILYSCLLYFLLFLAHLSGILPDKMKSVFILLPFAFIYISAILIYLKGYTPARFYVIGYSFILASLTIYIFRIYGMLPGGPLIAYCFNIGFILEVVILSFALGDKIRVEKDAKEASQQKALEQSRENQRLKDSLNRELEIKIEERTKELQESNEKLQEAQVKIKQAYKRLEEQAQAISRLNEQLNADNKELKINVKELSKARVMFKAVNFDEFSGIYPNDDACLRYLAELKWKNGYQCRKCKNDTYSDGRASYSRRCTKCGYEESATAFTIFHRNRLPLTKAFYMVFLVGAYKKGISSEELSRKLELRQKTCWAFKQKIVQAINASSGKKFNPENWGSIFLQQ